jgi:proton glutamate symport protein
MSVLTVAGRILENKFSYVVATFIGLSIGIWLPGLGKPLGAVGEIFLHILQLCVTPIVITSIALGIANFMVFKSKISSARVLIVGILVVVLSGFLGVGSALWMEPGKGVDLSTNPVLMEMIEHSSQEAKSLGDPVEAKISTGFLNLLSESIPSNIFESLTSNKLMQIVVFSLILGIGLGKFLESESHLMHMTRQLKVLFYELFEWFIRIFPLALICLLAKEGSLIGLDQIIAMGNFIARFYILFGVIAVLALLIIKFKTKASFRHTFSIMLDPVLIGFVTQNGTNAIPSSILSLRQFNYNQDLVQLVVPLGTIIGRFGYIMYFGFCTIFALQIYGISLGVNEYTFLALIIAMAGLSSAGQEEISLALAALVLVLNPIGIPLEGILPLLAVVDLFISPFRTSLTVLVNCAAISLMSSPQGPLLSLDEIEAKDLAEGGSDLVPVMEGAHHKA